MRAWQFTGVGEPPANVDVPEPRAGEDEVVVEVRAAGLCHSDVGFLDGSLASLLAFSPITLGHEIAGVVSELGAGVEGLVPGQRVAIYAQGSRFEAADMGSGRNGGYAEKVSARAVDIVPLPEGVDFAQAAVACDAGMTAYHSAVTKGGATAGSRVGIVGLGGLGMTAARICVLLGAEVFAAERDAEVRAAASVAGVSNVVTSAGDLAEFDLDLIVDYAGFGTTTAGAVEAVKHGGLVVQVGLGQTEATISTMSVVMKQVRIEGSVGGLPEDLRSVLSLIDSSGLAVAVEPTSFDEIGNGLKRLQTGDVRGKRLVATF
jgi:alcohol dehydrogenase, propanol-preferring